MQNLDKILKDKFWFDSFRDGQKEIIENIVEGNNTLVFMPTWWWKSLTYQLPWIFLEGLTIVISPLISLMKDQVDKLNELWIKTRLINSTISQIEIQDILNDLQQNKLNPIKFLYIAPERLNSQHFINTITKLKIAQIAIDEAHCISQWWHDFRPSYMKILGFIKGLKEGDNSFPIVALTATATEKVREDIIERLWVDGNYKVFISWFDRKNIAIFVREISTKVDKLAKVLEVIENTAWTWIIYCSSRKMVKEVFDFLQEKNISSGMYTWELKTDIREDMQNNFMNWAYKVIVATNAFWMWIDKKDIRFVIHYNLPWSIENYYQEVWRAGRDWKNSFWIVLASYQDTKIQEFFIENTYPSKKEVLKFYDYLYKCINKWEWKNTIITKTYYTMNQESWLSSDMKVWSIIKILEKYWILKRGIENREQFSDFRWRWITLIQDKRAHSYLLIDWKRQESLENEAYYKLEQIKKLLFYPSCRKKFILEYFGDKEDLTNLWDNCKACDYCLDKNKIATWKLENLVPLSVFWIVLDVIQQFNFKFWVKFIANFLRGSKEKRIFDWWYEKKDNYWVLSEYSADLVDALIESLFKEDFLEKLDWKFPLVWLSDLWIVALKNEKLLKESEKELQEYLHLKVRSKAFKNQKTTKEKKERKSWNYEKTLQLYKEWLSLSEIAKKIDLKPMTIENHFLKLYEKWDLSLIDILKLTNFDNLNKIKNVIINELNNDIEKLKPIKEKLEELWFYDISYLEIKIAIAMIEKKDL